MGREAWLKPGIWQNLDEALDGRASAHAKILYAVLLTDSYLTSAGLVTLRLGAWARDASLTTVEALQALEELSDGDPFTMPVVYDRDTAEVLVRTRIRNDVMSGPKPKVTVLVGALRQARRIESPLLRRVMAAELWKLPPLPPDTKLGRLKSAPDPHAVARELDPLSGPPTPDPSPVPPPPEPSSDGVSDGVSNGVSDGVSNGACRRSKVEGRRSTSSSVDGYFSGERDEDPQLRRDEPVDSSPAADSTTEPARSKDGLDEGVGSRSGSDVGSPRLAAVPRPDVEALCRRLADRMVDIGCKPPRVTAAWRDAARLLLDADERDLAEVRGLIDWTFRNTFWRGHVLTMPKFRDRYDRLRLVAIDECGRVPAAKRETFEEFLDAADLAGAKYLIRVNYFEPDPPRELDLPERREWLRDHRRKWISEHEREIRAALATGRRAS